MKDVEFKDVIIDVMSNWFKKKLKEIENKRFEILFKFSVPSHVRMIETSTHFIAEFLGAVQNIDSKDYQFKVSSSFEKIIFLKMKDITEQDLQ